LIVLDIRTFIKAYRITIVLAQNKDMMVKIFAILFSAELSKKNTVTTGSNVHISFSNLIT